MSVGVGRGVRLGSQISQSFSPEPQASLGMPEARGRGPGTCSASLHVSMGLYGAEGSEAQGLWAQLLQEP